MIILKILLSLCLFYFGVVLIGHGSSSAFDLGVFLLILGVFHFLFWPPNKKGQ